MTNDDREWIVEQLKLVYERIEKMETTLLTEFHKWARPNEARQRRYSQELREFEMQLENHEDRLKQLEGRE
jgi:hypothetical protein